MHLESVLKSWVIVFQKNNIIVDSYDDDNDSLIDEEYKKIKEYYKMLDEKQDKINEGKIFGKSK